MRIGMAMKPIKKVRYDGLADWYDAWNKPFAEANQADLVRLLGAGEGLCLDVGCGTGLYFEAVRGTGRTPIGVDRSADQLRHARTRGKCAQADAAALPFADACFPTVLIVWLSTDVSDFTDVVREAARVLRPGGLMLFCGAHPCFMGPHIEYREDGGRIIHPTYRLSGWHKAQSWWRGRHGPRTRVGMSHVPLADFLRAFLDVGLVIDTVEEPEPQLPVPVSLTLRLVRPVSR